MTKDERQESLIAARDAYKWLKYHLVHSPNEPLQGPILSLLKGFEILDEKEQLQAAQGVHGDKGGRPRKTNNGGEK